MSASGFTLTLLLFETIAAACTDQHVFWLLIGPAPLVIGFAAIGFLRLGFDLHSFFSRHSKTLQQASRMRDDF